jgi:predicted transcriptional regulator
VIDVVGETLNKLTRGGFFGTRMVEKASVGIYISDNSQAGLMFPRAEGEVDMTTMFYSEDQKFCGWCLDLFSYYFRQDAKKFDVQKTRVVE